MFRAGERDNTYAAINGILSGYDSGFELVDGINTDAVEHFVALSVKGSPRLLLPPSHKLMRAAIKGFRGDSSYAGAMAACVKSLAWAGAPLAGVSANLSLISPDGTRSPLSQLISEVLRRDDIHLALRLSFGRPNAKTVAMAISESGEVLCFAKLGSEAMTNGLVAHEGAVLERFDGTDLPLIVPTRLYSGTWADRHSVLVTGPLRLEPLPRDARIAHRAAAALASENHVTTAFLQDSAYWQDVVKGVATLNAGVMCDKELPELVDRIERGWGERSLDFGACHGDWTRANLGMIEGRLAALDWERFNVLAPAGIDIAHFTIFENASHPFRKSPDIVRTVNNVEQSLESAGLRGSNSVPLVMLALLQMVIRFKYAQQMGLRSADHKFGPALRAGLDKWAG